MKKVIEISCMLYLLFLSAGCSDDKEVVPKEVAPIDLQNRIAVVDHIKTRDTLIITSGNGNYYAVPRNIRCKKEIEPEKAFRISFNEDTVFVERIFLEDLPIIAHYYIMDKEGERKTILIENPGILWMPEFDD